MKLSQISSLFILIILLLVVNLTYSQTINGIVNSYARVTNIVGNQFTIGTPAGKTGASLSDFDTGKKILIYQAKGASINTGNNSSFGQVSTLGNAGRYEIATVQSRSGNTVTFTSVVNSYSTNGMVQLISIPQYNNVTTNGTLTSQAWNQSNGYGGVLILQANTLTLGANISVDGQGFVGGARSSNNGNGCTTIYRSNSSIYGEKGEGISTYSSNLRGQGPIANGGGGGSTHNAGGGGGSNHGQGGQGGIGWNCTSSNYAGGTAGDAMTYNKTSQRLFFGGGGGGGQQNNSVGTNGGNGGGIIILIVNTLTTNCSANHVISALGNSVGNSGNDGGGGGGAGGVILIHTQNYQPNSCQINLTVDGGDGGNVGSSAAHGGGGGGGSGLIYSSIAFPSGVNTSGSNGADGEDNTGGNHSGNEGTDEPIDIVIDPEVPGVNPVRGPGGHLDGLRIWFMADPNYIFPNDNLSGSIGDGQQLKSWENLAAFNNYLKIQGANTNASFENSSGDLLNYNAVVRMNNTNRNLLSDENVEAQTIVVVTKSNSTNSLAGLVGLEGDKGIRKADDSNYWGSYNNDDWNSGGNSFINGSAGYQHDREWHIVYQERGSSHTNKFYAGGYYNNRGYYGDIAEIISYDDRLSNQEQNQIETYLAIKYGITLENKNYINSDGSIVWNSASNSAYNNDIFGIGRDNISLLNQSQSKSINGDAALDIQAESTLSDRVYLIFGNDNATLTDRSTEVPSSRGERIARIWKVARSGNPGTVELSFDLASLGISSPNVNDFALLISSSEDFTSATEHVTGISLNASQDVLTFTNVSVTNNQYITLATKPKPAPGGGEANLEFWLKADAGTSTTTDGVAVTTWSDQLNGNNAVQRSGISQPIYRTNRLNFNPILDYSGSTNRVLTIPDSDELNNMTSTLEKAFSIVFTAGSDINTRQVLYEEGGTARGINTYIFNGELYIGAWNLNNDGTGSPWGYFSEKISIVANKTYLLTFNYKGTNAESGIIELVESGVVKQTISSVGRLYAHGADIGVGGMVGDSYFEPNVNNQSGNNYFFKGHFAEISYAKEYLDTDKRNKIETYLALKYGITLDQSSAQNYMSSNGTVVWNGNDNSLFNNDITGIGLDVNTSLAQFKSKSINSTAIVTIANGTDIDNPTAISTDNSFLIWSNNGGASGDMTGDYLGVTNNGINRIWRVSETGTIGTVTLQIPKGSVAAGVTTLFVSSDASFPNTSATEKIALISNGANWEVTFDFDDYKYFTFGKLNSAPELTNIEATNIEYCNGDEVVSSSITVADDDNDMLTATITISGGFIAGEDQLIYSTVSGVTATITDQTIQLSSSSVTNMQNALITVKYRNTKNDSSRTTGNRTISFIVNDGFDASNQLARDIEVFLIPAPIGIFHE